MSPMKQHPHRFPGPCGVVHLLAAVLVLSGAAAAPAQDEPQHPLGEFILSWQVCGPFDATGLMEPVVENEGDLDPRRNVTVAGRAWKTLKSGTNSINFEQPDALGPADHAVGFAYAEIESEREGDVILGVGSDDAVMAWWNGRQVLVQDVLRGVHPGEDQVVLRMRKGRNRLLLKVYDAAGGWFFAADLRPAGEETWAWRAVLPMTDEEFLERVARKCFDYFWNEAHPETGLVPDHVPARAGTYNPPCSVAALGFGLTGICIADARGWITRDEARDRVLRTLRFVLENVEHEHGFLYHFVNGQTGARDWRSEVSSIDTALFLAGALTCRGYFGDRDIAALADELYTRVDWPWMLNGQETLCMGWKPETGFLTHYWEQYSEHMVMYLLGLGSPTHPLPPETWYAWKRPYYTYDGMTYVQAVPLFLHQYSHAWVDFRDRRDALADYFKNSILATKAHRAYCLELKSRFPSYGEDLWGFTASQGPRGYMVWGGPPPTLEYPIDGTVVPCAAGGSIAFVPDLAFDVLRNIHDRYGEQAWGRYGFLDAFHPQTGWVSEGYIGIDVGVTLLMIENRLTGNVWKWFVDAPEIREAMRQAGFKRTGRKLEKADLEYLRGLARDTWACIEHFVHADTQMPYDSSAKGRNTSATNIGLYLAALAAARDMGFITAEDALARAARVLDGVEKFPTWKGFAQCWHGVEDLQPSKDDVWVSVVDTGNLALCLAVAAQAFPELGARCRALLDAMEWDALYDANAEQLYGGYDMVNDRLNPDWRIETLATDSRAGAIMAVASGKVPPALWNSLLRQMDERYHVKFLKPGWVGGGLFMQYLTGIFLDERNALMGRSAANLAYENMRHADVQGLPAWGWSACTDPDGGYLGWGKLRDEVVTPHASVLAIEDFAPEVMANLYELQRRGARAPYEDSGKTYPFGFRDSINLSNGHVSPLYLVLDQSMVFLSLANFLENGLVRRYFHADPGVQAAVKSIAELAEPEGGPDVSICEPGLGGLVLQPQVMRGMDVPRTAVPPVVDGDLSDWAAAGRATIRFPENGEFGVPPNKDRFEGSFLFAWDEDNLYIGVDVKEDELVCDAPAHEMYKGDAVELFFDPKGDAFVWGDAEDFQIGLSPWGPEGKAQIYAWFQKCIPPGSEIHSKISETEEGAGYTIETRIPWSFLKVTPEEGLVIPASFALHTVNKAGTSSAKLNWSLRAEVDRIYLGELHLAGPPPAP